MKQKQPLFTENGVSLLGVTVAIAAGALFGILLIKTVTSAVEGQRLNVENDDAGEFSAFLRTAFMNDSTCTAALAGQDFALDKPSELQLSMSYADLPGKIGPGFRFANGAWEIKSITIESTEVPAVTFSLPERDSQGRLNVLNVQRRLGRVRLSMHDLKRGGVRDRFFDVPILIYTDRWKIRNCNNQITLVDACQALGLTWDTTTDPPSCNQGGTCVSGGTYTEGPAGLFMNATCVASNPATGACTCPAGFTDVPVGSVNIARVCLKRCDPLTYQTVHQCFRCQ